MKFARFFSVAPMMDWTDRHYRRFIREISHHAWLYTEMIHTQALIHGNASRFLQYDPVEHPIALQLGGSSPSELATCARLAQTWGYDEVNLNVGCPSDRVQSGQFGACLLREPQRVSDAIKAMRDAVSIDITIKHRIGLNNSQDNTLVQDFIGHTHEAGCNTFIVHARNAVLTGLSPKENRVIPPLNYERVYGLKRHFPDLTIIVNGGITTHEQINTHMQHVDGVMVGRAAYHHPWIMLEVDRRYYADSHELPSREEVVSNLEPYVHTELSNGTRLSQIVRHWLGLYHGQPGAKYWRHMLSDSLQGNHFNFIKKVLQQRQTRSFS